MVYRFCELVSYNLLIKSFYLMVPLADHFKFHVSAYCRFIVYGLLQKLTLPLQLF